MSYHVDICSGALSCVESVCITPMVLSAHVSQMTTTCSTCEIYKTVTMMNREAIR
jgi:hypothetical protein